MPESTSTNHSNPEESNELTDQRFLAAHGRLHGRRYGAELITQVTTLLVCVHDCILREASSELENQLRLVEKISDFHYQGDDIIIFIGPDNEWNRDDIHRRVEAAIIKSIEASRTPS